MYPFPVEEKVLMLYGVNHSPHSVSFAQLFRSLRNTSHFAWSHLSLSAPLCLKHRQVWLPTSSHSSNSTIPIFVFYSFFFAYLSSWCLPRKGLAIPLNAKPGCLLLWVTPFPTSQCPLPQTVARAGCPPYSPARSPTFVWQVFLRVLVPL
ncbi:hypothetical protein B296_00014295 [Ensete ventricosum]|uniref:Uncharacterized protein n=1 Tax=Ensete ventricosum TaxID=4639 RepID=A0A426XJY1_ENSVE|nr:hypothetical protein B296_00014295 [Ensete ventricosum]